MLRKYLSLVFIALFAGAGERARAEDSKESPFPLSGKPWTINLDLAAPEAKQAALADENFVYVVSNKEVVKYDRSTGQPIARSTWDVLHLNSGAIHQGRIYLAHSNYPAKPDRSDIKILDPESMKLSTHHDFGSSEGSLTWAFPVEGGWWCHFAYYGKENHRSYVVEFDADWKERKRWRFPAKVVDAFEEKSSSGGVFIDQTLVVSGHDRRELYLLRRPLQGNTLEWLATRESPFPGQAIAIDPKTGGLVGIDRMRRRVIIAH